MPVIDILVAYAFLMILEKLKVVFMSLTHTLYFSRYICTHTYADAHTHKAGNSSGVIEHTHV